MSSGLRIWDSSGVIRLDVTDRITRIFASYSFSMQGFSTTVFTVPGYSTDGTWFFFIQSSGVFTNARSAANSITIENIRSVAVSGVLHVMRL